MKLPLILILSLYLCPILRAETGLNIRTSPQDGLDHLLNLDLFFESLPDRRYRIEVSENLNEWNEHSRSPFAFSNEGYELGQIDTTNRFTPKSEFYRVSQIPWKFMHVFQSDDWLVSSSLTTSGDTALFVFQNLDTNTLYYSELNSSGVISAPEAIATTGVEDEAGNGWDNSGYFNVGVHHTNGTTVIICISDTEQRIICFSRKDNAGWEKSYITDAMDSHFWSNAISCVDPAGNIAVAYLVYGEGVYVSWTNVASLDSWNTIGISDDPAPYQNNTSVAFAQNGDLLVRFGSSFRVEFDTLVSVTSAYIPGELQVSQFYGTKLLALNRTSNGIRIYTSEDDGDSWTSEYSTIKGNTISSGQFDSNGQLSLYGALTLHRRDINLPEWTSEKIGSDDSNSNHTILSNGTAAVLLIDTSGNLLLAKEDPSTDSNQSQ